VVVGWLFINPGLSRADTLTLILLLARHAIAAGSGFDVSGPGSVLQALAVLGLTGQ
jgi:hypothetical protein